jgi:hypothetical protein
VSLVNMRDDCSFCWYRWNWWPSLFTVSFHNMTFRSTLQIEVLHWKSLSVRRKFCHFKAVTMCYYLYCWVVSRRDIYLFNKSTYGFLNANIHLPIGFWNCTDGVLFFAFHSIYKISIIGKVWRYQGYAL